MNKIKNNKGFTLPETLIAFLIIGLVITWVTQAIPGIQFSNRTENNRLLAVMRNIETLENTRKHLYDTGEIKKLSSSQLTGSSYGNSLYYSTFYETFDSASEGSLKKILDDVLIGENVSEPRFPDLIHRDGSTSEMYKIVINTTVAKSKFKRTELSSFLYTNTSPNSNIDQDNLQLWLKARGKSNFASDNTYWKDLQTNTNMELSQFDFNSTSGWTGESLLFDGINDTVTIPSSPELKSSEFSIELYLRPFQKTPNNRQVVFVTWNSVAGYLSGYTVEINPDATVSFGLSSKETYLKSTEKLDWGNYVHIVGTFDGATQNLYLDGKLVATRNTTHIPVYDTTTPIDISSTTYDVFKGNIKEIRFYAEAMTQEEVKRNYTTTTGKYN